MPGKRRYGTVGVKSPSNVEQPAIGVKSGNDSTMTRLRKLYKPPVYPTSDSTDEYTDELMRTAAEGLLFADKADGDPVLWPGGVDRTFSGSPNIPVDVKVGGGGLPMTAYGPNIAAPGPNSDGTPNTAPDSLPDLSKDFPNTLPLGVDGTKNPAKEAASIAEAAKSGDMALGGHGSEPAIK